MGIYKKAAEQERVEVEGALFYSLCSQPRILWAFSRSRSLCLPSDVGIGDGMILGVVVDCSLVCSWGGV